MKEKDVYIPKNKVEDVLGSIEEIKDCNYASYSFSNNDFSQENLDIDVDSRRVKVGSVNDGFLVLISSRSIDDFIIRYTPWDVEEVIDGEKESLSLSVTMTLITKKDEEIRFEIDPYDVPDFATILSLAHRGMF